MDAYRALIHENISYGDLIRDHPYDADLIDGYVELMVEVCCTTNQISVADVLMDQCSVSIHPIHPGPDAPLTAARRWRGGRGMYPVALA